MDSIKCMIDNILEKAGICVALALILVADCVRSLYRAVFF